MRLQHDAPPRPRVIQHLEQQVLVAVGGVMPQALLVHALGGRPDFLHVGRVKEATDDRVALALQLLDEIRHAVISRPAGARSPRRQNASTVGAGPGRDCVHGCRVRFPICTVVRPHMVCSLKRQR